MLAAGGGAAAAIVAGILLNARYIPMGVALAPSLRAGARRRALIGQAMIDFSWAAASRGGGRFDPWFMVGATLPAYPSWVIGTIAALAVTTGLIRSAGPVLLGGRDLPGPLQDVIALLAPALLAALVVAETIGSPTGEAPCGVTAAGLLLLRGRSTLVAIAAAAIVTAALRAIS